jgi:Tfp pilus assembly protein PilN
MSKVQFNLLPDVKMQFVAAERKRNLVISLAFLVSAVTFVVFLVMVVMVDVVQKKQLSNADKSFANYSKQLAAIPNVSQVLTVQNQLQALVGLHQQKHVASRLFTYLPQVTPTDVYISQFSIDFGQNSIQISGTAASQQATNTLIDTLKFTTYKINDQDQAKSAFPTVVETSFGASSAGASYSLTVQFDPILFSNNLGGKTPVLTVPKQTTTRSVLDDPSNLFSGTNSSSATGGQ